MGKRIYKSRKELEEGIYGKALSVPKDIVRPIFSPLLKKEYNENFVFYEDKKMIVLQAPVCDSKKLIAGLSHEACEAEIFLEKLLVRSKEPMLVVSLDTEYEEEMELVKCEVDEKMEDEPIYEVFSENLSQSTGYRKILSYQVSCYYKGQIVRLIFFSKTIELLGTETKRNY